MEPHDVQFMSSDYCSYGSIGAQLLHTQILNLLPVECLVLIQPNVSTRIRLTTSGCTGFGSARDAKQFTPFLFAERVLYA